MDGFDDRLGQLASFDHATAIRLYDVCELLKSPSGGPLSLQMAQRWTSKGSTVPNGPPLRLPAVKIGNCLWTMPAWVATFARVRADLGRPSATLAVPVPVRSANAETRGHRDAVGKLKARGMAVG